jgi:hypothetical protein
LHLQQRRRARRPLRDPYFLGGALLRPYRIARGELDQEPLPR